jgi:hypothetical protein
MDMHTPDHVTEGTVYRHSPLPPGNGNIRLLRLLPSRDRNAVIKCHLFDYSLESGQENYQESHLYEALSYVWGDPTDTLPIIIGRQSFSVTKNLYSALLRLRNHSLERILWVDAVCMDQANHGEKEDQIQYMAKIYGRANRVIVWLGDDADDGHQALENIRVAAEEDSMDAVYHDQKVTALLQRPWFERIWVSY